MRVVKGDQIREVLGEKELAVGVEMRAGGGGLQRVCLPVRAGCERRAGWIGASHFTEPPTSAKPLSPN